MKAFLTYTDVLTLRAAIRVMERASEQLTELTGDEESAAAWDIIAGDLAGMMFDSECPNIYEEPYARNQEARR